VIPTIAYRQNMRPAPNAVSVQFALTALVLLTAVNKDAP
jgi:hypothetical protein